MTRARRQYDAVDPDHRLIAAELERRWNEALRMQALIEQELDALRREQPQQLSEEQRQQLLAMGEDVGLVWNHPRASVELKKRILRCVLEEIMVRVEEQRIVMVLHWRGADHTELQFAKNRTGQHRWTNDQDLIELVRALARQIPDGLIASLLNRMGKRTAHGHTWTKARVCTLRSDHQIAVYREGERAERGELTREEAAAYVGLHVMAMRRLIARGEIVAKQFSAGTPWVIRKNDLDAFKWQLHRELADQLSIHTRLLEVEAGQIAMNGEARRAHLPTDRAHGPIVGRLHRENLQSRRRRLPRGSAMRAEPPSAPRFRLRPRSRRFSKNHREVLPPFPCR